MEISNWNWIEFDGMGPTWGIVGMGFLMKQKESSKFLEFSARVLANKSKTFRIEKKCTQLASRWQRVRFIFPNGLQLLDARMWDFYGFEQMDENLWNPQRIGEIANIQYKTNWATELQRSIRHDREQFESLLIENLVKFWINLARI